MEPAAEVPVTDSDLIHMRYYETYYYVNIIHNVLEDPFSYLRGLNNWHEDREQELFRPVFPKWSLLHDLAQYLVCAVVFEQIDDVLLDSVVQSGGDGLWIDNALEHHGIEAIGFANWVSDSSRSIDEISEDDIYRYHDALDENHHFTRLTEHLAREIFYVLFSNRQCMTNLNKYVAGVRSVHSDAILSEREKRTRVPAWAKRVVFFRDRGMCVICHKDLGGILSTQPDEHYDHIVPLAKLGANDVTNLQLLCKSCNLSKGSRSAATSDRYQVWYADDA